VTGSVSPGGRCRRRRSTRDDRGGDPQLGHLGREIDLDVEALTGAVAPEGVPEPQVRHPSHGVPDLVAGRPAALGLGVPVNSAARTGAMVAESAVSRPSSIMLTEDGSASIPWSAAISVIRRARSTSRAFSP
jgi:hypothetical protein